MDAAEQIAHDLFLPVVALHQLTPAAPTATEAMPPIEATQPEQRVAIEGGDVERAGTAEGSYPKDAAHPDVIAARAALAGIVAATLTDHHDYSEPTDDERNVRGYVIDPRGHGRVALYWLEGGRSIRRDERPHGAALDCLADRMTRLGWSVEKMLRVSKCVFAHRPLKQVTLTAAAVAPAASSKRAGQRCRHEQQVRGDVSGNPITACARKHPNQDVGVFNDEGCMEVYDCAVQAANRAAEFNAKEDALCWWDLFGEELYRWDLMCPEHPEQPFDTCEECNAEEEQDLDQVEQADRP